MGCAKAASCSSKGRPIWLAAADVEEIPEGLLLTIRRSKTDQEGRGTVKGIARGEHPDTCPVSALLDWLQAAGITAGPIFRHVAKGGKLAGPLTAQSVALIVKAAAKQAKLDSARYSGHSLRAGLATSAAAAGVSERKIMDQTGYKSERMVRRYIRDGELFCDNAAGAIL